MIDISPSGPGLPRYSATAVDEAQFRSERPTCARCQRRFIGGMILVDAPLAKRPRASARAGSCDIRDFQFFVTDRRYTVPTLAFVTAEDEHHARRQAIRVLGESSNHLSVEVREGDALLFTLAANPEPPASP